MRRANRFSARLLTRTEAAAYCGLSIAAFTALCPVRPISLGNDKRLERYDIVELDKWIDSLASPPRGKGGDGRNAMDVGDDQSSSEGDTAF